MARKYTSGIARWFGLVLHVLVIGSLLLNQAAAFALPGKVVAAAAPVAGPPSPWEAGPLGPEWTPSPTEPVLGPTLPPTVTVTITPVSGHAL